MNDLSLPISYCHTLDAQEVVRSLGLNKAKESKKWGCPSCNSSDALHVYKGPGRGSYCWSCGVSMDAIALVQKSVGADFVGAVKWLAQEFGFADLIEGSPDLKEFRKRLKSVHSKIEKKEREKKRLEAIRRKEAQKVYFDLWCEMGLGAAGVDYLESRGIPSNVAHHFGICSVESAEQWEKIRDVAWEDDLELAGLTGRNDRGTYPVPWRAPFLVIPYLDDTGKFDLLRFRDLTGNTPKYLSPLGHKPHAPYLSWSAFDFADDHDTLFICEGEINALSVVFAGSPALGACGSGTWNPEWSKGFRWYSQVVILCDGDEAGLEFSMSVKGATEKALGKDWARQRLRRRKFMDGMDANDALQKGNLGELLYAA